MFEKEAEDYADKYVTEGVDELKRKVIKGHWQDGAEFGYKEGIKTLDDMTRAFNREHRKYTELRIANEWHYVKDGDLPKDDNIIVLCICGNGYIDGKVNYILKLLTRKEFSLFQPVYQWKEIVLPELKENE